MEPSNNENVDTLKRNEKIEQHLSKYNLQKTLIYQGIGFIIALIITIIWFGHAVSSLPFTIISTIIFICYYRMFEHYWSKSAGRLITV